MKTFNLDSPQFFAVAEEITKMMFVHFTAELVSA